MPTKTDQTYEIPREGDLLDLTADEVALLSPTDRERRVDQLLDESRRIFERACDELIVGSGKAYLGTAILFSGGNDSTTLLHAFRDVIDVAIHANTGTGVPATLRHVRDVCEDYGIPLFEEHPPVSYEELVLAQGFPGPAQHFKMFQRLKERAIMLARAAIVGHPWRERIVFLAGRRKDESERRSNIPLWEREGSAVWISPFAYWTKLDLNTFRGRHSIRRNLCSDLMHMSGECLCGSFAKRGELDEIAFHFPERAAWIRDLERRVRANMGDPESGRPGPHPSRCAWGWGADRDRSKAGLAALMRESEGLAGSLCSACVTTD